MKRTSLLILFIALAFCSVRASLGSYLIVETTDEEKFYFVMTDDPALEFDNQKLLISSIRDEQAFEIDDVKQFYFGEKPTGIKILQTNELRIISNSSDQIEIEGIPTQSVIKIFSIDGKEQQSNITLLNNKAVIDHSSLPQGVYIVKINKNNIKYYKK